MKENFKKEDIIRFNDLEKEIRGSKYPYLKCINLSKANDEIKHIKIPLKLFGYILMNERPKLLKYTPFNLKIDKLERKDNYWLKDTNYLGITYTNNNIDLFLNPEHNYENVELLWIILHEFRHIVQHQNMVLDSCTYNNNLSMFYNYFTRQEIDKNKVEHVFHELIPSEVDANIFACEILNIDYPGSKFEITNKTLKQLNGKFHDIGETID